MVKMQLKASAVLTLLGLLVPTACVAASYLQESPDFLKPCRLQQQQKQNNVCLSETIQQIFQNWRNGVPGLSSVGALDPFRVGRLRIAQRVPPNLDVRVELRNMTTHGMSNAKILNSTTLQQTGSYSLGFHVQMPHVNISSSYKLKGHVLLLNLNSAGKLNAELDNLELYVAFRLRIVERENLKFLQLTAVKTNVAHIAKIRVHFTNLFGGNKQLERSANELFNENWRVLFDVLRPVLTETFDVILQDRFDKIFSYLPAKYLFEEFV
ncbi:protein takeout-like [Drosophila busckii]|uniref:protein takeout-like n=1 Tax=Drosophila busckii TaxID=30019 RepID=UPI001433170A|nr:protein takeout-like [Drosophila busckii]